MGGGKQCGGEEILGAAPGSGGDPHVTFWIEGWVRRVQDPAGNWRSLVVTESVQPGISLSLFIGV